MFASGKVEGQISLRLETLTDREVIKGIGCLLSFQGDHSPSGHGGATRPDVSTIYPKVSVEVYSLYLVSVLVTKNWQFADGVALLDTAKEAKQNSPTAVRIAYQLHRQWFRKVRHIGLMKVREEKLLPLSDTRIIWPGTSYK